MKKVNGLPPFELPSEPLHFDQTGTRIAAEWLTSDEAARYFSISPAALRMMVHRGQINAYKFGRRLRFKIEDCRALIIRKGQR